LAYLSQSYQQISSHELGMDFAVYLTMREHYVTKRSAGILGLLRIRPAQAAPKCSWRISTVQKKTVYVLAIVALLVVLAVGAWLYLAGQGSQTSQGAASTALDQSALIRAQSPTEGKQNAAVVIVEFFDPACGTCRSFYPEVKALMAKYPDRIRLVMRYAPFHKGSDKVVAVLEAAHRQGKFWPALEALFEGQDDWASNHTAKVDLVWKYLEPVGLNMEQLAFDVTAPEVQKVVAQDLSDANTLGVSQTPEYFVNGKPLPSFGLDQLKQLVADEVARTR
jgi:protein-disulfide isomerase